MGFALVALLLFANAAHAIVFRAGDEVTISQQEVIEDDLYVTGERITIDGIVHGDIVAAGRHIVLNGSSFGDFIAAGQGIVVNGAVADDLRAAGMAIRLGESAAVGDDVVAAAFSLESSPSSVIAGSVVYSGFQALLAGEIGERLLGQMAALRLEGSLGEGGEVSVAGDEPTPPFVQFIPSPVAIPAVPAGMSLGSAASLGGELIYTSAVEAIDEAATGDRLVHVEVHKRPGAEPTFRDRLSGVARRWIGVLILGAIGILAVPAWLRQRSSQFARRPLAAGIWGVCAFVGVPVSMAVAAVAVLLILVLFSLLKIKVLLPVILVTGFLVEAMTAASWWLSYRWIGPIVIALWVGLRVTRQESGWGRLAGLAVGCVILGILCVPPFLGGVVSFLVGLLGLGTLTEWAARHVTGSEAVPPIRPDETS